MCPSEDACTSDHFFFFSFCLFVVLRACHVKGLPATWTEKTLFFFFLYKQHVCVRKCVCGSFFLHCHF